jgi:putative heme iron utilization protein
MTDPFVAAAQVIVAQGKFATLSTLSKDGHPFGSLVAYAGLEPVLLLSELAEHTHNLRADPRASLLVTEAAEGDPLAHGRVTLVGRCAEVARAEVEADYLAMHPSAVRFLELKDFRFWRLDVESARYIGGFGKIGWIDVPGLMKGIP